MIYIFEGFRHICSLPAYACRGCGQCCKAINCEPLQECCDAVSQNCKAFLGRPLNSLVFLIYAVSITEIYCCYVTASAGECEFTTSVSPDSMIWSGVQALVASLGLVFAPYFQCRVWSTILRRYADIKHELPVDTKRRAKFIPKKEVQDSFIHEFKYDFGVLFYFFAQLFHAYWSYQGRALVHQSRHEGGCAGAEAGWAYTMGFVSVACTFTYAFVWYCCSCCAGSVSMTLEEEDIAGVADNRQWDQKPLRSPTEGDYKYDEEVGPHRDGRY